MSKRLATRRVKGRTVIAVTTIVTFILSCPVVHCHGSESQTQASAKANTEARLDPDAVREAEQRLTDLGYWAGPIDQTFDLASRQALIAFQKVGGAQTYRIAYWRRA